MFCSKYSIAICLSFLCLKLSCGQIVVQNDANSNFYSVSAPSSRISFYRTNGLASSPFANPPARLQVHQPQPMFHQQQPIYHQQPIHQQQQQQPYYQPAPQQVLRNPVDPPQEPQRIYSLASDVSSVKYSSDNLNYNF